MNKTGSSDLKRRRHRIVRTGAIAGMLFLISCAVFLLWENGVFLPGRKEWSESVIDTDLNSDGIPETVSLKEGVMTVSSEGSELFRSDRRWHIMDQCVFDIDRDGGQEILLLLWKRGSFGSERPFWNQNNSFGFSRHIYIFKLNGSGAVEPLWMSSDIGFPAGSIEEGEGGFLIAEESSGRTTCWEWQGFGLTLVSEGEKAGVDDSETTVSFIAAGDNIIHESIVRQCLSEEGTLDLDPVYAPVCGLISSADLAAVGQESVFTPDLKKTGSYPFFASPTEAGDALADTGFDIILQASNHAADQGADGIAETLLYWKGEHPEMTILGISDVSGSDAPAGEEITDGSSDVRLSSITEGPGHYKMLEKNGIRIALFDYTYGTNVFLPGDSPYDIDDLSEDGARDGLIADLKNAAGESDVSICFLHIGEEYTGNLSPEEDMLLDEMIDAGADVIICAHAHIICPYGERTTENGKSALVYYGLGNFVSHQRQPEQLLGGLASFRISKTNANGTAEIRIGSARMIPVVTHFTADETAVYPLEDYTEELASVHFLNRAGSSLSVSSLQKIFKERCKNDSEIEILTRN